MKTLNAMKEGALRQIQAAIGVIVAVIVCLSRVHAQSDAIVVTSPSSGSRFAPGDTMTISWTIKEGTSLSGIALQITPDAGISYATIKWLSRSSTSYTWVVDSIGEDKDKANAEPILLYGDSCWIQVRDYENKSLYGISGYFSIVRREQSVKRGMEGSFQGGSVSRSWALRPLCFPEQAGYAKFLCINGRLALATAGGGVFMAFPQPCISGSSKP